jgi:hypothetical protein
MTVTVKEMIQFAFATKLPGALTTWERDFLVTLLGYDKVSPKQKQILRGIAFKVLLAQKQTHATPKRPTLRLVGGTQFGSVVTT